MIIQLENKKLIKIIKTKKVYVKMQAFVNVQMVRDSEMRFETFETDFMTEFAKGYLQVDITEKEESLKEYENAFKELEDKNSFKADYISTLIDVLKMEIKDLRKI